MAERLRRLAVVLNYYSPYTSGLTVAAQTVAERLVHRGWHVTVVASRHDRSLPAHDDVNGVEVVRTPVVARLSKGVVSPTFPVAAARAVRAAAVANLHLPMLEAGAVARLVRGATPLVVTYQCDVSLPPGALNRAATAAIDASTRVAFRHAFAVCPSSADYARSSRLASAFPVRTVPIPPPSQERPAGAPRFRETAGLHVGFLGRIVEEKGVEYLVEAFRGVPDPDARLLVGGEFERVAGGSTIDRVRAAAGDDERIRFLGFLPDDALADFYASVDVFALPSVNSLEAFGIVQVEAMLAGVPVVATDLPGVRTIVQSTGFGAVVPPRDPSALRGALLDVAARRHTFGPARARARTLFSLDATVDAYEALFEQARAGAQRLP